MRLTDLEPRWIHPNIFVFQCPHCVARGITEPALLCCKDVQMRMGEQFEIFEKEFGKDWNTLLVPCDANTSWSIRGTRPTDPNASFITDLTVSPSIDASASGHWHGYITNGEVLPPA